MSQNVDIYFDDQFSSGLDEIASIFNLRSTLSKQYLSSSHEVLAIDKRIQRISAYLLSKPKITKSITFDILEEAEAAGLGDTSDVFASSLMAFLSADNTWIAHIVNGYLKHKKYAEGLMYALAWLPWELSAPWISRFLSSKDLDHKWLAVSVCSLLGRFPAEKMQQLILREDCQQHHLLFEKLICIAGQAKRTQVHSVLRDATEHETESIQLAVYWSRWMMNDRNFADQIKQFSLQNNHFFAQLSPYIILQMGLAASKEYIASALRSEGLAEDLIINAVAAHGDPSTLPWLMQKTQEPALMPCLGLAFFQITGIAVDDALVLEPEPEIDLQSDSPCYLSQDMSLPYPKPDKLLAFASHITRGLKANTRYFLGQPVGEHAQFVSQHQANPYGLARRHTRIHAAYSGQPYLPYDFLLTRHPNQSVHSDHRREQA